MEKKKTLLYILSKENLEGEQKELFLNTFNSLDISEEERIDKIKTFYISSGSKKILEDYIKKYHDISINLINDLDLEKNKKSVLKDYCSSLINRVS